MPARVWLYSPALALPYGACHLHGGELIAHCPARGSLNYMLSDSLTRNRCGFLVAVLQQRLSSTRGATTCCAGSGYVDTIQQSAIYRTHGAFGALFCSTMEVEIIRTGGTGLAGAMDYFTRGDKLNCSQVDPRFACSKPTVQPPAFSGEYSAYLSSLPGSHARSGRNFIFAGSI